jgi:hypothetical protein
MALVRCVAENVDLSDTGSIHLNGKPVYFDSDEQKSIVWGTDKFIVNDTLKLSSHLLLGDSQEIRFSTDGTKYLKWNPTNSRFEFNSKIYVPGSITTDAGFIIPNAIIIDSTMQEMKPGFKLRFWETAWGSGDYCEICANANGIYIYTPADSVFLESSKLKADYDIVSNFGHFFLSAGKSIFFDGNSQSKSLGWSTANSRFEFNNKLYTGGSIESLNEIKVGSTLQLKQYTTASKPTANSVPAGSLIWVTDPNTGGQNLQCSDGTNWKYIALNDLT